MSNLVDVLRKEGLQVTAGLEVTNRCNLACTYCYQEKQKFSLKDELSSEDWLKIIFLLKGIFEPNFIQFKYSGGELFLVNDICDSIEESLREGSKTTIISNGVFIPRKFYGLLESYSNCFVEVSVDGTEEIHNTARGKFDKTISSLRKLSDSTDRIGIRTSVYKQNVDHLEELMDFLNSELKNTDLTFYFQPIFDIGFCSKVDPISLEEYALVKKRVSNSRSNYKQKWRLLDSRVFKRDYKSSSIRNSELFGCSTGAYILIKPNGDFSSCEFQNPVGNITDYFNNDIINLLHKFSDMNSPNNRCLDCFSLTECGGCRIQPLAHNYTHTLGFRDCKDYISALINLRKTT